MKGEKIEEVYKIKYLGALFRRLVQRRDGKQYWGCVEGDWRVEN